MPAYYYSPKQAYLYFSHKTLHHRRHPFLSPLLSPERKGICHHIGKTFLSIFPNIHQLFWEILWHSIYQSKSDIMPPRNLPNHFLQALQSVKNSSHPLRKTHMDLPLNQTLKRLYEGLPT